MNSTRRGFLSYLLPALASIPGVGKLFAKNEDYSDGLFPALMFRTGVVPIEAVRLPDYMIHKWEQPDFCEQIETALLENGMTIDQLRFRMIWAKSHSGSSRRRSMVNYQTLGPVHIHRMRISLRVMVPADSNSFPWRNSTEALPRFPKFVMKSLCCRSRAMSVESKALQN